ncbi:MAG: hypothetical protein JNL82_05890 [Myxococcales bacterium]|nr:hypothetical protein [Myxococcales bacterium]
MPARRRPCLPAVGVVLLLSALARPARADFTADCAVALRRQEAMDLVARVRAAGGACGPGPISTDSFRTTVTLRSGDRVHTARVAPRACLVGATRSGPALALEAAPELAADCPEAHAALAAFVAEDHPLAVVAPQSAGWTPELARIADPRTVTAALAALALVLGALALRRRPAPKDTSPVRPDSPPPAADPALRPVRRDSQVSPVPPVSPPPAADPALRPVPSDSPSPAPTDSPPPAADPALRPVPSDSPPPAADPAPRPVPSDSPPAPEPGPDAHGERAWWLLAAGLFGLGLGLRLAVAAAPANWYGAFLPPAGWGDLRFGPGAAVLQAAVRAALPWTAELAFAVVRLTGALVVPLTVLLVRRLGGTLPAAALAGLFVALAPVPVRMAASSAEHVLAGCLALAAWVVWLRTADDPSPVPRLLAVTLAALAALTRADCLPQLAAVPLWTTLAPRPLAAGHAPRLPPARRRRDAAAFLLALAGLGVYAFVDIVLPSHHPGPDAHALWHTARKFFSQFWTVAVTPPHWLPLPYLALVLLGLAAARRHARLLLAILATLVLVFIPLGRSLVPDGLTGARYFVLLFPLLAVTAAAATRLARPRRFTPARTAVALALLAVLLAWQSLPAWRHETTFQAEHRLLAAALADPRLAGCTLWYVPPRQPVHEPDLDCCLDPARSPLALQAPRIRFEPVPHDHDLDDAAGCHLYYEGAICSLDPALAPRAPQTAARVREQCARLRRHTGDRELLRASVTRDTLAPRSPGPPAIALTLRDAR